MTNGTEPSLPLEITEQSGVISGQKVCECDRYVACFFDHYVSY